MKYSSKLLYLLVPWAAGALHHFENGAVSKAGAVVPRQPVLLPEEMFVKLGLTTGPGPFQILILVPQDLVV